MTITQQEVEDRFGFIRPDEVAECWDGVLAVEGLYEALWDCVGSYTGPTPEESEEPVYGLNNLADYWHTFSQEHQEALIRLEGQNNMCHGDY